MLGNRICQFHFKDNKGQFNSGDPEMDPIIEAGTPMPERGGPPPHREVVKRLSRPVFAEATPWQAASPPSAVDNQKRISSSRGVSEHPRNATHGTVPWGRSSRKTLVSMRLR